MEMNFKASRLLKWAALPSSSAFLLFFIRLVLIEHLLCSRYTASFLGYNGKRKLRMLKKKNPYEAYSPVEDGRHESQSPTNVL